MPNVLSCDITLNGFGLQLYNDVHFLRNNLGKGMTKLVSFGVLGFMAYQPLEVI